MAWFKVDDGFPTHRKVLAIPRGQRRLAAVGAWTLTGAWSAANGTEGRIPDHIIDEFGIPRRVVDDLVSSGLWHANDEARQMHDFLDYNPSAEQVAADREASRERQRRARERRRQQAEAAAERAHLREVRP